MGIEECPQAQCLFEEVVPTSTAEAFNYRTSLFIEIMSISTKSSRGAQRSLSTVAVVRSKKSCRFPRSRSAFGSRLSVVPSDIWSLVSEPASLAHAVKECRGLRVGKPHALEEFDNQPMDMTTTSIGGPVKPSGTFTPHYYTLQLCEAQYSNHKEEGASGVRPANGILACCHQRGEMGLLRQRELLDPDHRQAILSPKARQKKEPVALS